MLIKQSVRNLCNELGISLTREDGLPKDRLDIYFDLQRTFDERVINGRENLRKEKEELSDLEFKDLWTQRIANALSNEVEELRDETNYKWWKNPKTFEVEEAMKELVDIMHFAPSGIIRLGYGADDFFNYYIDKNLENHARQSGTSKDATRANYSTESVISDIPVMTIFVNQLNIPATVRITTGEKIVYLWTGISGKNLEQVYSSIEEDIKSGKFKDISLETFTQLKKDAIIKHVGKQTR